MKKNMVLVFGILLLVGCKEQKEKVAEFLIDSANMSNRTDYFYLYDSGRLKSQTEKTYRIMFEQVVDSTITQVDFEYNTKGLLIKESSQADFEDKPTIKIYDYDKNDSLISEISINQENDTTFWEVYKYFPDGRKTVFHRFLSLSFDPNQALAEALEDKKLDTSFFRNEFEYVGGLCKTQRQFNKKGNLIKIVNYDHNGTQLIRETHLTYINDMEMVEKIKTYDYSKSVKKPDFYALDSQNDTLELCVNEFRNGQIVTSKEAYEYGRILNKIIYENNKVIGLIGIDLNMHFKTVISYEYYENGDLKVVKSYSGKLSKTMEK